MKYIASLAFAVLAGCATTAAPTVQEPAATPAVAPAPAPMPKSMARAEFDRRLAAGELRKIELTAIAHREIDVLDKPTERSNEIVVTDALPNGWSTAIYADRYRRLWIATFESHVHAPPNVIISATRVFEKRFAVPIGYRLVGKFDVVD